MPRKNIYFSDKALALLPKLAQQKGMNDSEYVNYLVIQSAENTDDRINELGEEIRQFAQLQSNNSAKLLLLLSMMKKLCRQPDMGKRGNGNVRKVH